MSDQASFFAELKRRNVYRVAVAYAVVGWLLVQIATQVFPFFEIPNWTVRLVVVLLLLGFPVALLLAWAFEITPEGIKRTDDLTPQESVASRRGRKLIALTAVAAVIAASLFAFRLVKTARWAVRSGDEDGHRSAASLPIVEKSIAVLPFENLSSDKENGYFAAGIQDEILTRLAKIGALKVISRSSTQQYQSKPANLRDVARELGVAHLLEGSVQKSGQIVHVNVQLIKAATDEHLWAESYDRTLDNIFGVESEIAQNIAEALKAKLTGAEEKMMAEKPTKNPGAYDAYLRGLAQSREQDTENGLKAAQVSFEEAVRLDPQFAAAWATLARTHSLFFLLYDTTPARRAEAERTLAEAVRLQPTLAETSLARAYVQYWVERDYAGALEMMRQLRTSWPNNAEILEVMSFVSARLGQWNESLDYIQRSMALNPKDLQTRAQAIEIALAMRDFDLVIRLADEGLRTWPGNGVLVGGKASAFQGRGKLDEAQTALAALKFESASDPGPVALMYQFVLRRDPSAALQFINAHPDAAGEKDPKSLPYWASVQQTAGRIDDARATFTRVREMVEAVLQPQPQNAPYLGILTYVLAQLDQREDAFKAFDRFAALSVGDARTAAQREELGARIFARFGEKDRAISSLERLLVAPSDGLFGVPVTPAILRLDPVFDSLRGDPRFEKLCSK
jgi:TolB-like protein/Tfp pilus assembly protein PilF